MANELLMCLELQKKNIKSPYFPFIQMYVPL